MKPVRPQFRTDFSSLFYCDPIPSRHHLSRWKCSADGAPALPAPMYPLDFRLFLGPASYLFLYAALFWSTPPLLVLHRYHFSSSALRLANISIPLALLHQANIHLPLLVEPWTVAVSVGTSVSQCPTASTAISPTSRSRGSAVPVHGPTSTQTNPPHPDSHLRMKSDRPLPRAQFRHQKRHL
ncbi:hypothetical protein C8J57DRAFT_1587901 [Mycena rebaudengoi]|nr:hypothetical protein C8J57DRAFT_1587901 [Mycena rebaudengoi]